MEVSTLPAAESERRLGLLRRARRIGLTLDTVPVATHQFWARALPGAEWFDVSALVRNERSVKSAWELERMRETARLLGGVRGFNQEFFMGPPGAQARVVGHGLGLELDELPVLAPGFDAPLRQGQVVA